MSFKRSLGRVLAHEGGYANNANDRGGETYRGIARNFYPNWSGWGIIDSIANKSWNDVFTSLDDLVADFYEVNYWVKFKLESIESPEVAGLIFDWVVNSGRAIKKIQKVLNSKFGFSLVVDNQIGKNTINAINSVNSDELVNAIVQARVEYYQLGVEQGWLHSSFLNGLIARAEDYKLSVGKSVVLSA